MSTHNGERSLRALTADQKAFFQENGYLPYKRVVSDEELKALCQRTVDIIEGKLTHLPPRYIQLEKAFRDGNDTTTPRIDIVRKITRLCYFDDLFQAVATKPEIVDVIEELLGPNIKFFTDQLMMKSRFNGTVTDWHQDSPAWPYFVPQDHVIPVPDLKATNSFSRICDSGDFLRISSRLIQIWYELLGRIGRCHRRERLYDGHPWQPQMGTCGPRVEKQISLGPGDFRSGRGGVESWALHVPPRSELPPDGRKPDAGPSAWPGAALYPRRDEVPWHR